MDSASRHNQTKEMVEEVQQHYDIAFQALVLRKMASQRLQQKGGNSLMLMLFEFSRHGQRNTSQSNERDGRTSQTAFGYSIPVASFEENGSPKKRNFSAEKRYFIRSKKGIFFDLIPAPCWSRRAAQAG